MIARTASMLLFPPSLPADIVGRLAHRHRLVAINPDAAEAPTFAQTTGLLARVKGLDPRPLRLIYQWGLANKEEQCPDYGLLGDADTLHRLDGSPIVGIAPHNTRVINLARTETRRKLRAFWRDWLAVHDIDAVMFDTFHPYVYADWLRDSLGCPSGGLEGAVQTPLWWAQALLAFCRELRGDLELDGRQLWANGLTPLTYETSGPTFDLLGPSFVKLADAVSGVLDESVQQVHLGEPDLRAFIARAEAVVAKRRGYLAAFQPGLFGPSSPEHPWAVGPALARYCLAAYLLIAEPAHTYGLYHDREPYRGFTPDGTPYLYDGGADWDQDLGMPLGGVVWNAHVGRQPVAWREYERAIVGVNPKVRTTEPPPSSDYGFLPLPVGSYRIWNPVSGGYVPVPAPGPGLNIAPGEGLVMFKVPS